MKFCWFFSWPFGAHICPDFYLCNSLRTRHFCPNRFWFMAVFLFTASLFFLLSIQAGFDGVQGEIIYTVYCVIFVSPVQTKKKITVDGREKTVFWVDLNGTYLTMDCYLFPTNVSPLDTQTLFYLLFYSITIFCPTINRDDIYMILVYLFRRKLCKVERRK